MPSIEEKVIINAPVAKVFAFVTNPQNWTEYAASLAHVSDISSPSLEPGTTFTWEYRMLGVELRGIGSVAENVLNKSFAIRMEGAMQVYEQYSFSAVGGATRLTARIEYRMPPDLKEKIGNTALAEKINRRDTENLLAKIRIFCEEP